MNTTREEHLNWCKERALQELEYSGPIGALGSMMSDLRKWHDPLYSQDEMVFLFSIGRIAAVEGEAAMKHWVEGFN